MNLDRDLVEKLTVVTKTEARAMGISDVAVFTKENDLFVPDGMAFIIARGAIDVDPEEYQRHAIRAAFRIPYNLQEEAPAIVRMRIPSLVWRVDGRMAVCGDGRTVEGRNNE